MTSEARSKVRAKPWQLGPSAIGHVRYVNRDRINIQTSLDRSAKTTGSFIRVRPA